MIPNPCVGTVFTATNGKDYMFTFNATDAIDELYTLDSSTAPINLWPSTSQQLKNEAVAILHTHLAGDPRWKSYQGFLELSYPDSLAAAAGDRQLFF